MSDSEKKRLLSLLEAHGKAFLESIGPTNIDYPAPAHKRRRHSEELSDHDTNAAEWHGIDPHMSSRQYSEEEASEIGSLEYSDDEFIADSSSTNVVVFSDVASRKQENLSKSQMGAFMSSKISKLRDSHSDNPRHRKTSTDREGDWTNAQNDVLLHKLIHTKLLSGSLNQDLKSPPGKKRKALEGRILELTTDAKLGKGERQVRDAERNKAAKRVREGIAQKQKERQKQELEEAKNLGNYHPSLKRVFEASVTSNTRKRTKGLRMGVGKFSHGSLRLSRDDVNRVMGEGQSRSRRHR